MEYLHGSADGERGAMAVRTAAGLDQDRIARAFTFGEHLGMARQD